MKDRFLSKAKRVNNGEWVEGNIIYVNKKYYMWPNSANDEKEAIENMWFIDPQTLCQCTGLKDKNGTLIFEGDMVDSTDEDYNGNSIDASGITTFNQSQLGWYVARDKDVEECLAYLVATDDEFEVIGNIHDKEVTT